MNNTQTKAASTVGSTPTAHWIEVRDASGRRHLEMRWSVPGAQSAPLAHAA
jgi:hypothetical protein